MDSENTFTVQYYATNEEREYLWNGIFEYNKLYGSMQAYPPYEPFSVLLRDREGKIIAGILTKIYLKCVFIELLWVDGSYRKSGLGSRLLMEVEKKAKEIGCSFIHLDTFSFQAIDFYKKYGYTQFATIEDYPEDIKRYFLKKYL